MLKRDTLIHAERERYFGGIALHIAQARPDSNLIAVAQPLLFVEQSEQDLRAEPTMIFDNRAAQLLMDELWQCGIRPSEGTGSAGSLAATERHLADMKAIAFHTLKINK